MIKIFGGWVGLLLAVFAAAAEPQNSDTGSRCLGSNPSAPVTIEVFSDYQCPACREFYLETIRPVLADYGQPGKVCVVYREFPLASHPHSRLAARYGQAAGRLGRDRWIRVTDALYYYQSKWSADGKLEGVVAEALPSKEWAQLRTWLNDAELEAAINRDVAEGKRRGVRSTPTIFITANGKTERANGVVQYSILRRYLDSLLGP